MLDDDLLSFVRASIRSTWALELLLLLRKHAPQGSAADELVRALRATPALVTTCLHQLEAVGLVTHTADGKWCYAPVTLTLENYAGALERAYAERPVTVINAIVASPNDRLKTFSDAFRFPKKNE